MKLVLFLSALSLLALRCLALPAEDNVKSPSQTATGNDDGSGEEPITLPPWSPDTPENPKDEVDGRKYFTDEFMKKLGIGVEGVNYQEAQVIDEDIPSELQATSGYVFNCDMDQDRCFTDLNGEYSWEISSYYTASRSSYRPSRDTTNKTPEGKYMLADGTYEEPQNSALMGTSFVTEQGTNEYCVDFNYYMNGVNQGVLGLMIHETGNPRATLIWHAQGSKGSSWNNARLPLIVRTASFRALFISMSTNSRNYGSMAVDDFKMTRGACAHNYGSRAGQWSQWGRWSPCDTNCGHGYKRRERSCARMPCRGETYEFKMCYTSCSGNRNSGYWGSWSSWSACSVSCGSGYRQRTRSCYRQPCYGDYSETGSCNTPCQAEPTCQSYTVDLRSNQGNIYSPGYERNRNYPNNARCSWRISLSHGQRIKFYLQVFSTEYGYDRLEIWDGNSEYGQRIGSFSGSRAGQELTTRGSSAYIKFTTDGRGTDRGFWVRYSAEGGGNAGGGYGGHGGNGGYGQGGHGGSGGHGQGGHGGGGGYGQGGHGGNGGYGQGGHGGNGGYGQGGHGGNGGYGQGGSGGNSGSCGRRSSSGGSFQNVLGGRVATPNSWPWMVPLVLSGSGLFCGGSIVSKRLIVTAAHCVFNRGSLRYQPSQIAVNVGAHSYRGGTQVPISQIIVHPNYARYGVTYDIALLKTSSDIQFNSRVSPICLPDSEPQVGKNCYATGWGQTQFPTGQISSYLKEVQMSIVNRGTCMNYFGRSFGQNQLCVGQNSRSNGVYRGDSGGPLACEMNGRYVLSGVASFVHQYKSSPDAFANVVNFRDFIRRYI